MSDDGKALTPYGQACMDINVLRHALREALDSLEALRGLEVCTGPSIDAKITKARGALAATNPPPEF